MIVVYVVLGWVVFAILFGCLVGAGMDRMGK